MLDNDNVAIKTARVASGMTQEQCARILNMSIPTYAAREKLPKSFTLDELEDLFGCFSQQGKEIVASYVANFFVLNSELKNH